MAEEIEIKLAATPESLEKIRAMQFDDVGNTGDWQSQSLHNTYFDTAHCHLRDAEIGVRIRRRNGECVQSVKSAGRIIGGLYQRNESEVEVPGGEPDILAVEEPYLQIILEEAVEEDGELQAIFTTGFTRHTRLLGYADGSQIELALDAGKISCGDLHTDICEVELELKAGDSRHLFELGEKLIGELSLVLDSSSKAERGYILCKDHDPGERRFTMVELDPAKSAEEAFEAIGYAGLRHWQFFEKQLRRRHTSRSVVQMHRALLFIQHMYSVFGTLLPRHAGTGLRDSWARVTHAMSPVYEKARQTEWLATLKTRGHELPADNEFEAQLAQELEQEIRRFIGFLDSPGYNKLMLGLSRWLYRREWRGEIKEQAEGRLQKSIRTFAGKQLDHVMHDLTRTMHPKNDLLVEEYCEQEAKLARALDIGLFFGSLFDNKNRQEFRQHWLDLLESIRDLKRLELFAEARRVAEGRESIDEDWLLQQQHKGVARLDEDRREAFQFKPYWTMS